MTDKKFIVIDPADNIALALEDLQPGDRIEVLDITIRSHIPTAHKFARQPIAEGEVIRRYAQIVANASQDIAPGEHVHVHNVTANNQPASLDMIGTDLKPTPKAAVKRSFMGYHREDGRVGTRNLIAVISTVNCSATATQFIADHFRGNALDRWPNVDGVIPLIHSSGCAISPTGEGLKILRRTLAGYIRNPNIAGAVVLGLGCEINSVQGLFETERLELSEKLVASSIQEQGGTKKAVQWGIEQVEAMLDIANRCERAPALASELLLGTQCGGSDAVSGISANPTVGKSVDLLVAQGGTGILSETVELHGADQLLIRRAATREVGERLLKQLDDSRDRVIRSVGQVWNMTDGNIAGGLSTSPEKSLGSFAKSGSTNLVATYDFAENVTAKGFVYMDTPAYDPAVATGQIAGGANLLVFTTGRGSAFGSVGAPSIKVSSNTALFNRQNDDIDFNAGSVLDGDETMDEAGARLLDLMLEVASGKKTKSEELGMGANEFVPWVPSDMI